MAQEMVVKESLSPQMTAVGEELTRKLERAGFVVDASLWYYNSDSNSWRFIVANPAVRKQGPRKAYEHIQSVLSKTPANTPKVDLKDVTVLDSRDPLIRLLGRAVRKKALSGIRVSQNIVDGVLIEDAYIYRMR